jgi:hypothetical protein
VQKPDPKYIGVPNICFSLTKKTDDREKEYKKQRKQRGFDDSETWSLNGTIANFIAPRLKRLKEIADCHPSKLSVNEWDEILDKMIFVFDRLSIDDGWFFEDEEQKKIDEGLDLFRQYFFNLWW